MGEVQEPVHEGGEVGWGPGREQDSAEHKDYC